MKRILVILFTIMSFESISQVHNVSKVYVRDSILSRTNNTDLFLYGRGSGKVNIEGAYTLPSADGSNGYVVTTDGAGSLSLQPPTGGSSVSFGSDNQVPFTNSGGTDFDYSSAFTFDGTAMSIAGSHASNSTLLITSDSDVNSNILELRDIDNTSGNTAARLLFSGVGGDLIGKISGVNFASKGLAFQNSTDDFTLIINDNLTISTYGEITVNNDNLTFGNGAAGDRPTIVIPSNPDHVLNGLRVVSGTLQLSDGTAWSDVGGSGGVLISGTPVTNDFARWTNASTIEGRSYAETRSDLNLVIGADIQAYDGDLTTIGSISKTDGNFIVANGAGWVAESGATARSSLGLGTMSVQNTNSVDTDISFQSSTGTIVLPTSPTSTTNNALRAASEGIEIYSTVHPEGWRKIAINNDNWNGTVLSVVNGGTGSNNATGARTNLGLGTMSLQDQNSVVLTGDMNGTTATFSGDITATDFVITSDISLKENVRKIGGNDIDYITYNYIGNDRKRFGVSAQQVKEVLPEAVTVSNGKLAVSYIDLLIYQIAQLEARINELEPKKRRFLWFKKQFNYE